MSVGQFECLQCKEILHMLYYASRFVKVQAGRFLFLAEGSSTFFVQKETLQKTLQGTVFVYLRFTFGLWLSP